MIGIVLLLGLTVAIAGGIVVLSADLLEGSQSDTEANQAEQALTQFDSKAARVALGGSNAQSVSLGGNSGTYSLAEDAGRIRLVHEDWNGTNCSCGSYAGLENTTDGGNTTVLYNETLGTLRYDSADTTLAYQGGGVWRTDGDNEATVVSPPEFHYRGSTLTLPVIRVAGTGSASGSVRAAVGPTGATQQVYANSSRTYPNGDAFENPVTDGNVTVEITSEYCHGWETYLRDRTEGDITGCDDNGTVEAELTTLGTQGGFDPIGGETVDLEGFEDEFDVFEVTLREDEASGFNNIEWKAHDRRDDGRAIELFVGPDATGSNECDNSADVVVYFSYDNGNEFHTWSNENAFEHVCSDGKIEVTVDFLSEMNVTYEEYSRTQALEYDADTFNGTETIDGTTYTGGDEVALGTVVDHYVGEMDGDADLEIKERQGNSNPATLSDTSSGDVRYAGGGDSLTYMHMAENGIEVELSG